LNSKKGASAQFLAEYNTLFKKYTLMVFTLYKIFCYLDKYFLKNANMQSLTEKALDLFRAKVFNKFIEDLRRSLLEEIRKDREDEVVEIDNLKEAI